MRYIVALLGCLCSVITWAQTTQPAAQPVDKHAVFTGLAALNTKAYDQAKEILVPQCARIPKNAKLQDPDHILASEALGVTYLCLRDYPKATPLLEAAVFSGKNTRPLVLNTAYARLQTANFPRALSLLDGYLQKHPADEAAINMFGLTLDKAAKGSRASTPLKKYFATYDKCNAQLEAEHVKKLAADANPAAAEEPPAADTQVDPKVRGRKLRGESTSTFSSRKVHHWGTEWLSEYQYQAIEERRKYNEHRIDTLQVDLAKANTDLAATQRQAELDRRRDVTYARSTTSDQNFWRHSIESTQHRIEQIQVDIAHAADEMPKPTWNDTYEPLLPDNDAPAN